MASILLKTSQNLLLLNKGAAEWVLQKCDKVALASHSSSEPVVIQPIDDAYRAELMQVVVSMASRGLRCICLAVRELPHEDASRPADYFEDSANLDQNMTAVAIVGK